MSNIARQIERSEARWKKSSEARQAYCDEIERMKKGETFDWRKLDRPSRVAQRLERLGDFAAAEVVMDGDQGDFNPYERILDSNDLTDISFLERGLNVARTVARIQIRGTAGAVLGHGTGFMISPRLLVTNNHVLPSDVEAGASIAQFEFLNDATGVALDAKHFHLEPDVFFLTNETLDYTIVAVEQVNSEGDHVSSRGWCPLIKRSGKALIGERVNIIQHPSGDRMQIALRDNTIVAVVDDFLHYEADTMPGSSGSCVLSDQWELAALHHSGVPDRDSQNRILLMDGRPWNGSRQDVDKIKWRANEGVRISSIVSHVKSRGLTADKFKLWHEAFTSPPFVSFWQLFSSTSGLPSPSRENSPIVEEGVQEDGTASWLFRLSFGPVQNAAEPQSHAPQFAAPSVKPVAGHQDAGLQKGQDTAADAERLANDLFEQFQHDGPYYDQTEDTKAREEYWLDVDWTAPSGTLFSRLKDVLEQTHQPRHSYSRARHQFLYPAIDLHEDGMLRNIYSGTALDPRELIASEIAKILPRAEALGIEATALDANLFLDRDDLWDFVEEEDLAKESSTAFNCEHVVCQSWFNKRQPMKADIHHLFACEPGCNSFRSNIPYWSFSPTEEAERDFCGRREGNKFEPEHGHGAVARATMYFLMRYPGEVGDKRSELTKSRIDVLLKWHQTEPTSLYEKHRNWLTQKAQGNRNPFIDQPQIATKALLSLGFDSS